MKDIKDILVPLDFSGPSLEAVNQALDLAELTGGHVRLLHVVDTRYAQLGYGLAVYGSEDDLSRLMAIANERLDKLRDDLGEKGKSLETKVVAGVPFEEVLDAIAAKAPDLVVMGTHGRTGMERIFIGSQCELIVRRCPVPVLVVHGPAKGKSD